MKKVAMVFVLAVFVPSMVLAWLAFRSLHDQQFLLERQQSLLFQGVADGLAKDVQDALADYEHNFTAKVAGMLREGEPRQLASSFDDRLRKEWPLALVGFVVTLNGEILAPSPLSRPEARTFCNDNNRFLGNRESAQVYLNPKQALNSEFANQAAVSIPNETNVEPEKSAFLKKNQLSRNVIPQQPGSYQKETKNAVLDDAQLSKLAASEAEFRQLVGEANEGTVARFVDNKLSVLFWYRSSRDPQLVFGAQLSLARLVAGLRELVGRVEPALREEICVALLDDMARPVALSQADFRANWKRPFMATEIGEALPHWEVGVYLLNPAKLTQSARTLKLTLGWLIGVLVFAIGIGGWLIVADLNRQLTLAGQKTDFVSNVSHELKTPLTSIRMFSELLAEGRVQEEGKRRAYLGIITAETARLTRLINNVLDFSRIDRGEKTYHRQNCDLVALLRETAETFRPHLEAERFEFGCALPETPLYVYGDRDALAQVIVNLLSNAEKYSGPRREISLSLEAQNQPLPYVEVRVWDRGLGVPKEASEKIFEQFYRACDSLSSGIQGSGLGLTLAREIARAHGGDVVYEPREGGGSCFILRLPRLSI